ncbi:MAG: glycosyl hydrolase [Candidatus Hodarchaeales archaeon]
MSPVTLLIGTRKGSFLLKGSEDRKAWKLEDPIFLGQVVNHIILDPRNNKVMLMAARTGHLGPTIFRSEDSGKTWKEAEKPPAFSKAPKGEKGRVVKYTFWLTPGHRDEPNVFYAGTNPHALFITKDGGNTWNEVEGFNNNPDLGKWTDNFNPQQGTPDGPVTHSIRIFDNDKNHMLIGLSIGGLFESFDKGRTWKPLNNNVYADFLPNKYPEYGQDPHNVQYHPLQPERLYMQNHCGIYRLDRGLDNPDDKWIRIGNNMPSKIGDIGFPLVLHPKDPKTIWVFPMDGTDVWPRTSTDGEPAVYVTHDAGESWIRQDKGLPEKAWFTVKRQCMTNDYENPLGLYFGTTSGEIWASFDEGDTWQNIVSHLPHIYSLEVANF